MTQAVFCNSQNNLDPDKKHVWVRRRDGIWCCLCLLILYDIDIHDIEAITIRLLNLQKELNEVRDIVKP